MDRVADSIFVCAAAAILLAGCQKQVPTALSKEEPRQVVVAATTPVPQTTRDPSLPDAASALAAEDAAQKAKATDEAELQQKPPAQVDMTKQEEAKAMPLPSQANDHSTTALDKNPKGEER